MAVSTFEGVHEPLVARDVLLGRTTHVRRIVPNATRRMIGAWCFLDHFGPDEVTTTGGMWVPPHPHTGLQTVTWLFEGEGLHTDSLGTRQAIRPGQLNVMTAGHGISHAEVTPPGAPEVLHGVQLWVCLPDGARDSAPGDLTHLAEPPSYDDGATVTVLLGSLGGVTSPAPTYSPLVGAQVALPAGSRTVLPLEASHEYGVLVAGGSVEVDGVRVGTDAMSYLGTGRRELRLRADRHNGDAIIMLVGGEPFEEEIVMWWNFIGRSHEEVVAQREDWNGTGLGYRPERYGVVADFEGDRLLAPPMPRVRLRSRGRTG